MCFFFNSALGDLKPRVDQKYQRATQEFRVYCGICALFLFSKLCTQLEGVIMSEHLKKQAFS